METTTKTIKVGVLTISDTRTPSKSNADTFDSAGHDLKELINKYNAIESAKVVEYDCVTDDVDKIQAKMIEWCSGRKVDVLLSTGGTGFSPRDVTPEATLGLVQKLTPGISQAIMNESLKITPLAMLSRAVSGIYEQTLIINLPGSRKAVKECLRVVANVIPHAISLIKDKKQISNKFHDKLNSKSSNVELKIPECVSKIACRNRESPFPKISMDSALKMLKDHSFLQFTENNRIWFPTVFIFSTGDELDSTKDASQGYIRDTNSAMIQQLVEQDNYKGEVRNCGIVRDNWNDVCKQLENAFNTADILVTSGGVSMGEKDFIKHVLKEHFKSNIHFGRVDMKPGMPTTFATLSFKNKKKYVFCLPGNPVSAGVCTHLFLLPFLRIVSHRKSIIHSFKAKLLHSIDALDVRPEYRRALLKYENGEFTVSCLTNYQQSSRLLSFVGSNCLLQLPSSTVETNIKAETIMTVIMTKSMVNTYDAPILYKNNLEMKVHQNSEVILNKKNSFQSSHLCIKDVLNLMTENVFVLKTKNIPTLSAMDYVLHSAVYSSENLPPFPASIKDGYAIKYVEGSSWSQGSNVFKVVQVSVAGTVPNSQKEIKEGECARINTGAPLPPGANCVVQVEDTIVTSKSSDGTVELAIAILKEPKPFDNIRGIGSDIAKGQCLLDQNTELGPFEIALLRSVGSEEVNVYQHPALHIIPFNCDGSSTKLTNILEKEDFKGNLFTHSSCKNMNDLQKICEDTLEDADIIVICDNNNSLKFHLDTFNKTENYYHFNISNQKVSFGFGVLNFKEKKVVVFHITCSDSDSIYKCAHLFVLPFVRFAVGKKQIISLVKAKLLRPDLVVPPIDLSIAKFEKAHLCYEDENFNVSFNSNEQNCLVSLPPSTKDMNTAKEKLDAIVTENSDYYYIHY